MRTLQKRVLLLRQLTQDNNLTAYKIAKKTQISQPTIRKILTGINENPRAETVETILAYLQMVNLERQSLSPIKPPGGDINRLPPLEQINTKLDIALNFINEVYPDLLQYKIDRERKEAINKTID